MKTKCIALLVAAALLLGCFSACAAEEPTRLTTYAMGSVVQQTVYGPGGKEAAALAAQAVQELENRISWRVEGSEIAQINAHAGSWEYRSSEGTLATALEVAAATDGAFDPTIGPLTRLWDFDGDPHVPDPEELAAALKLVNYRQVVHSIKGMEQEDGSFMDVSAFYLADEGMALDLGAVGKGAACDEALRTYRASDNVTGAVIAVGGSVAVFGQKPDGTPWRIAVRDPKTDGTLGEIEMNSGYVSTSGSYEKCFTENGKTYHHILDPSTGYPAESGLVSVTVWMPSAERAGMCGTDLLPQLSSQALKDLGMETGDGPTTPLYNGAAADALSTACFVLGLENSLPLLEQFGAEAIFITEDDEIYCTEGIRAAFTLDPDKGYTLRETLP